MYLCVDNIQAENKMVRVVYRSGLVVLGIVIVLMVFCVFVVKDVVVVVGLNFIMFDLYDVNDMLF